MGRRIEISLRPAVPADARLLFGWVNDPEVRRSARSKAPIAWPEHSAWYDRRLASPDCRIFVAESAGAPIGQVRLDRDGARAEIDISVAADGRGQGIGAAMLKALDQNCWPEVGELTAEVRTGNRASSAMFERAGFRLVDEGDKFRRYVRKVRHV